ELALADRVIFMVMATGAAHSHSQPSPRRGLDSIDHVFDLIFLGNRSAFKIDYVIAIEARSDLLFDRCAREQVPCKLLDCEPVEGHVLVKGIDDPVAPAPYFAVAVDVVSVSVCIPREVEPLKSHPLAVMRRTKELVDARFVSIRGRVSEKGIDFSRGWRQA